MDCSRNAVPTVEFAKKALRLYALMGYNALQLYTEDTYEIEGEPYFGYLRGRFSQEELRELDGYAGELGIELIPCIQVLAHLGSIFKFSCYQDVRDCHDILLCGEEKTYRLIEKMIATVSSCFTSRRINIGMDEAHMVGLGKYLDKNGYRNRFDILFEHLEKVCAIAEKHGMQPMMWSDMFFRLCNRGEYYLTSEQKATMPENILNNLPKNISLVYWDYYHFGADVYRNMLDAHRQFNREIWFAGAAQNWGSISPSNGRSIKMNATALPECSKAGVSHIIITTWGDDGGEAAYLSVLPTLAHAASLAWGMTDMKDIRAFFLTLTGIRFDDFMAMDAVKLMCGVLDNAEANPNKYLLYNDPLLGEFDGIAAAF